MKTTSAVLALTLAFPFLLAFVLAFTVVISARAQRAHAMINQLFTGTPTSRRNIILPAGMAGLAAGQPILVGTIPMVTLDAYQSNVLGATCLLNGSFSLTVIGRSANSPLVTAQINPGDKLYASPNTGVFDAATNVTYGFSIDKNVGGVPFGSLDPTQTKILAGVTNTAAGVIL